GWLPTSRYSLAPFSRNTLLDRPHDTTRRKRYRATSSGLSRRWPRSVHVTPYSFSSPKIRRSTEAAYRSAGGTQFPGVVQCSRPPALGFRRGSDLRWARGDDGAAHVGLRIVRSPRARGPA